MTKQRTAGFTIYFTLPDWIVGTGITLLYHHFVPLRIVWFVFPLMWFVVATLAWWIDVKVGKVPKNKFRWSYGLQWPPQWFIGRLYYDGYYYVAHLGPVWMGRRP